MQELLCVCVTYMRLVQTSVKLGFELRVTQTVILLIYVLTLVLFSVD